jgi:D-3-phosphoglycerate dehydrogenase
MFALCRYVVAADAYVSGASWTNPLADYERFRGREIRGSTVGIVGLGQIGREVAQRALCLGARVLATDPFVTPAKASKLDVRLVSLKQLLTRSDFVTLHTGASKQTERMINQETLALMKPAAYLISTGAGNAVDLDALAEALRDGVIAGAGLDVFPGHLAPPAHPLLQLENAILTPHMGGATRETVERHSKMMVDDIERFLRGQRPRSVINPEALKIAAHGR